MADISTYIQQISRWQDEFPENALAHLIDREEESKPLLRDLLQMTLQHYKEIPEDYVGHIFAIYLLAEFRDPAGFLLALKFLELPELYLNGFFHDLLNQSYPAVIASCYAGDPKPLWAIITSPDTCYIAKVVALVAASILVNRKSLSRPEYAAFLQEWIQTLITAKDSQMLAVVAEEVADMHLSELYDTIKALYKNGQIDEKQYSSTLFETIMQSDYTNPRKFFIIDDIFEELNGKEYSGEE